MTSWRLPRSSSGSYLESDVPFIASAGDYIASSGGKRVRPALLLLASRLLGHDGEEEITYAAVIEFIHTASLVHDDIIDHATLRRGAGQCERALGQQQNGSSRRLDLHHRDENGAGPQQSGGDPSAL